MNPTTLLTSSAVVGALPEVHMLNSSCVKVAEYDHEDGYTILTFHDGNQYTYKE